MLLQIDSQQDSELEGYEEEVMIVYEFKHKGKEYSITFGDHHHDKRYFTFTSGASASFDGTALPCMMDATLHLEEADVIYNDETPSK